MESSTSGEFFTGLEGMSVVSLLYMALPKIKRSKVVLYFTLHLIDTHCLISSCHYLMSSIQTWRDNISISAHFLGFKWKVFSFESLCTLFLMSFWRWNSVKKKVPLRWNPIFLQTDHHILLFFLKLHFLLLSDCKWTANVNMFWISRI